MDLYFRSCRDIFHSKFFYFFFDVYMSEVETQLTLQTSKTIKDTRTNDRGGGINQDFFQTTVWPLFLSIVFLSDCYHTRSKGFSLTDDANCQKEVNQIR